MPYKTRKFTKYKFRAEALNDIFAFTNLHWEQIRKYIIYGNTSTLDVEFEFESDATIEYIKDILKKIPDSHVMRETLQTKLKYTGKRK